VDHLIIGGGIAGVSCARTLRSLGATGSILLASRELDQPYHRPPLTKEYLRGEHTRADVLLEPEDWWQQADVELRTRTNVTALDGATATAVLQGGEEIGFGSALLATGAMVRRLTVDGAHLEGIHYLRALGNADGLRRGLRGAEHVVIVGGSYIACETAASLAASTNLDVTMLMIERQPLQLGFGERAGRWFRRVLAGHRVEVVGGVKVERFEGIERVSGVRCSDGSLYPADVVVCGVGAIPDVMLARKSNLAVGEMGGVLCDRQLRSSAPGIWAAGDMCEYESVVHDGRALRIEHETVAADQGATVARNMLGAGVEHTEVPYFFSDLADWSSLEYVGPALSWDQEVLSGDMESGSFSMWYLEGERVRGVLSVNGAEGLRRGRDMIAAGASTTPEEIAAS
jgi:3-phenylpropionate/trans-cinnamate dioxygenase ferredoxin reductase subunit